MEGVTNGSIASGWLFSCVSYNDVTQNALFTPTISPLPSKRQLDGLKIDASTLAGLVPDMYVNKAIEDGGFAGGCSLVVNGDPAPITGSFRMRNLAAGPGVCLFQQPSTTHREKESTNNTTP